MPVFVVVAIIIVAEVAAVIVVVAVNVVLTIVAHVPVAKLEVVMAAVHATVVTGGLWRWYPVLAATSTCSCG